MASRLWRLWLAIPPTAILIAVSVTVAGVATFTGTNGPDQRSGGAGDDTFIMKAGNDRAWGQNGADQMGMGKGRDVAQG